MSEKEKIRKLLVVALKPEWASLKNHCDFENDARLKNFFRLKAKPDTGLLQIGCGLGNARLNFLKFLEIYDCETVLHFGACGALVPELNVGTVFVATEITDGKERIIIHESRGMPAPSGTRGILFSSKSVLKNPEEKKFCRDQSGASAVDMESFAVAQICREKNISYQSARSVFDALDDNLEAIGEPFDDAGNLNAGKLVVNLIKNPKLILAVPDLKRRADLGSENLRPIIDLFLKS